jgi:glycine cleavage system regulatory protein
MMATFVLTILGDDRPGLVSAVSAPMKTHGASWERSQLSRLAGKFAGIILVSVPDDRCDALVADLTALQAEGLEILLERTDAPPELPAQRLALELLGSDRPGIVAELSASLAGVGVSIEELSTDVRDAPMAGGTLFEARAVLLAPPAVTAQELGRLLEGLADELMVDVLLSED